MPLSHSIIGRYAVVSRYRRRLIILGKCSTPTVNRVRHIMSGVTSANKGHQHLFLNSSDVVVRVPGSHFHTFHGVTTTQDGHRHTYSGRTGLSISGVGPHGGGANHFHRFTIVFQAANGHTHTVTGITTKNRFIPNSFPNSIL